MKWVIPVAHFRMDRSREQLGAGQGTEVGLELGWEDKTKEEKTGKDDQTRSNKKTRQDKKRLD
jgi:hypothetical protein